ncbi:MULTISPECIES: hypothetical protein [Paenibacillus]|uniref:hypothetical protein n=1 Tax=Paenibacillus TaxID=44249 RepID=UPI0015C3AD54|nr:hypothetical protein [Paenibacillus odorifer]
MQVWKSGLIEAISWLLAISFALLYAITSYGLFLCLALVSTFDLLVMNKKKNSEKIRQQ